jgi:hypothetical protein
MKRPVKDAIDRVAAAFPDSEVEYIEDSEGGAFIRIDTVDYGSNFTPSQGWLAVHVTSPFPRADPYPQFVCPDLRRADGQPLGEGFSLNSSVPGFEEPATQVSRRANGWNPATDTLDGKLLRVLDWMRQQ